MVFLCEFVGKICSGLDFGINILYNSSRIIKKEMDNMKKVFALALAVCIVFSCTTAFAELLYRKGDANLDGLVTTGDALTVLRYSAGLVNLTDDAIISADFNRDGHVNSGDVSSILRRCLHRKSMDKIVCRAFVYNMDCLRASSDWVAYSWFLNRNNPRKTGELIYAATDRTELESFTDPALCPFIGMENADESGTLRELTERYDDAFFAENDVFFIATHEAMISKLVSVTDITCENGKTTVNVVIYYPEVAAQMSQDHFVIVEIPKAYTTGVETEVVVSEAIYQN